MRATMSGQASYPSYANTVIEIVRDIASALRSRGIKTKDALSDIGPIIGTSHRRVRTLFHRDREPVVNKHECMSITYRAGLFWLNESVRLRTLADIAEERGNRLVSSQLELPWETKTTSSSKLRRCA